MLFFGESVEQMDPVELRRKVVMLTQMPVIFAGPVTITVFLVTEFGYRRFFNRHSQVRQEVLDLRL